jgi:hypothetical protein
VPAAPEIPPEPESSGAVAEGFTVIEWECELAQTAEFGPAKKDSVPEVAPVSALV